MKENRIGKTEIVNRVHKYQDFDQIVSKNTIAQIYGAITEEIKASVCELKDVAVPDLCLFETRPVPERTIANNFTDAGGVIKVPATYSVRIKPFLSFKKALKESVK